MTRRRVASRGHARRRNCCSKANAGPYSRKDCREFLAFYSVALHLATHEGRSMNEIAEYMGISSRQ